MELVARAPPLEIWNSCLFGHELRISAGVLSRKPITTPTSAQVKLPSTPFGLAIGQVRAVSASPRACGPPAIEASHTPPAGNGRVRALVRRAAVSHCYAEERRRNVAGLARGGGRRRHRL